MRIIVLLDPDDEMDVSIATDEFDEVLCFENWNIADAWCSRHAGGRWSKCVNLDDDDD